MYFERNQVVEDELKEFTQKIHRFLKDEYPQEKFKPRRLLQGVYGQRQPGVQMMRVKVPGGALSYEQWKTLIAISRDYGSHNLHITTRQDIQLHFLKLAEVPDILNRLANVGLTTREACGNSFRNVTASPFSGSLRDEVFDVRPAVETCARFFLRHPDTQELPRKFKVAFSESPQDFGVTGMHDLGAIAKEKNGVLGFKVVVGGGLGSQPFPAALYADFIPAAELLKHFLAIARIFNKHGNREKRMKARIKFLVHQTWGIEKFKEACAQEVARIEQEGIHFPELPTPTQKTEDFDYQNPFHQSDEKIYFWFEKNVFPTKRKNEYMVVVHVPLGDLSPDTAEALAEAHKTWQGPSEEFLTLTDDQNLVLKGVLVPEEQKLEKFQEIYQTLQKLHLGDVGYHNFADPISCPGTTTCNLGITSSHGMAKAIRQIIGDRWATDPRFATATLHMSGCPNSCGRHHIATVGFFGRSELIDAQTQAPAYNVMLGGANLGDGQIRIAKKCGKILAKRVPEFIQTLVSLYEQKAPKEQTFDEFCAAMPVEEAKALVKSFDKSQKPIQAEEKINFDWGKDKPYVVEFGEGECAS